MNELVDETGTKQNKTDEYIGVKLWSIHHAKIEKKTTTTKNKEETHLNFKKKQNEEQVQCELIAFAVLFFVSFCFVLCSEHKEKSSVIEIYTKL